MRIDRLDVYYVVMPLIYPWRTAYGEDADIHSVLVKLTSGEHEAWSESTPFFAPTYLNESAGSVFYHVSEVMGPWVVGREYDTAAELDQRLAIFKGNSFAKAAVEIGWWTLQSRITGPPCIGFSAAKPATWRPALISASRTPTTCSSGTSRRPLTPDSRASS